MSHQELFADVAPAVTRSHKMNDRDHKGLANGSAAPEEHLPRYFAKSGHVDADPKKVKKEGGGRGNWYAAPSFPCHSFTDLYPNLEPWLAHPTITAHPPIVHPSRLSLTRNALVRGHPGEEAHDYGYTFAQNRRRSNSSTQPGLADFKTKFETVETEPVFEEALHGAPAEDEGAASPVGGGGSHEKDSSAESASMASVDEEERAR